MLHAGQIVRYGPQLWRVDYVNECRARLLPLIKRDVANLNAEDKDDRRGINVSPNSELPIVTNIDLAKDELDVANAERDLARLKHDLAKAEQQEADRQAAIEKRAAKHQPKVEHPVSVASTGRASGITWSVGDGPKPETKEGSLKALVLAYLAQHPGSPTKEVAAAMPAEPPAVAACLDRFWKAGVIVRSDNK